MFCYFIAMCQGFFSLRNEKLHLYYFIVYTTVRICIAACVFIIRL